MSFDFIMIGFIIVIMEHDKTKNCSSKPNININGLVIAMERDKGDHVLQVAIINDQFEKFIVSENGISEQLLTLTEKYVQSECSLVGEDLFGNKIVNVYKYKLVQK